MVRKRMGKVLKRIKPIQVMPQVPEEDMTFVQLMNSAGCIEVEDRIFRIVLKEMFE